MSETEALLNFVAGQLHVAAVVHSLEAEAFRVENKERELRGEAPAHPAEDFYRLSNALQTLRERLLKAIPTAAQFKTSEGGER